ncbi:MAG: hypothetical protein J0I20_30170 [Chloroflexi bacterium]|nr:hypothetical protein [Chloroflexota bacterium]OJV99057.1 MAG: hypothetical protein BGO39_16460 [Chloroflexi bacterium 54-19]
MQALSTDEVRASGDRKSARSGRSNKQFLWPFLGAVAGSLGLVVFYLGLISLAQGWQHAFEQLGQDLLFISPIVMGFGLQIGLFIYLRQMHARARVAGVAASTGTSAAAMLACCAHHLADILPVIGLSGAALFLNEFKTPLLWLGLGMNLAGVLYLANKIRQQRRMACHSPSHP